MAAWLTLLYVTLRGGADYEKVLQLAPGTPGIRQEILATKAAINADAVYIPPVQGGCMIEEIESDSDDEPLVCHPPPPCANASLTVGVEGRVVFLLL